MRTFIAADPGHLATLIPHLQAVRAQYTLSPYGSHITLPADDGTYVVTAESDEEGELYCYLLHHYAPGQWGSFGDPLSHTEVFTPHAFLVWLLSGGGLAVLRDWEV